MLIEKTGYTTFKVVDNSSNKFQLIDNMEFLTPFQEKQMSFQPDMILEYAHYLGDTFKKRGFNDVSVYADSYVTLNGRPSKRFIDPNVDLFKQKNDLKHKTWIIPIKDDNQKSTLKYYLFFYSFQRQLYLSKFSQVI